MDKKIETLIKLNEFREIYVLISPLTRAPYVACNPETFDDEVYVFYKEDAAKVEMENLRRKMKPVQVVRIDQKARPGFFINLCMIGVNAIVVNKNRDTEISVQVSELVKKKENLSEEEREAQVENPELLLTALYFMQELRRGTKVELTGELKELYEEMIAHFQKGRFIVPAKEDKQIPLLKQKDGKVFVPVFSDIHEYAKFLQIKKGEKLQAIVVGADKLPGFMNNGVAGVVLNPFGVNVPIQMTLKK